MSHRPVVDCAECGHNYTGWTTSERTNPAGEREFFFEHHCTDCGHVEEMGAAIVEPHGFHYAKYLAAGSEPDD